MPPSRPEEAHDPSRSPRVPSDPSERRLLPVCCLRPAPRAAAMAADNLRHLPDVIWQGRHRYRAQGAQRRLYLQSNAQRANDED